MAKDNGGFAEPTMNPQAFAHAMDSFDIPLDDHGNPAYRGMTMRQWYKGMALQGELAAQSMPDLVWGVTNPNLLAEKCAMFADAMIAEDREAEKEK